MTAVSINERSARGKAVREAVPRTAHAAWAAGAERRDPVEIVECSSRGRLEHLIPVRYGRMLRSPFTFLRGTAAIMAHDLAETPTTGLQVQACGDCHLLNFGLFATPERNLLFDVRDFDETLRAPWEWDVKRLGASFVVAARLNGFSDQQATEAAVACARSYRQQMRELATMSPLEVWYHRVTAEELIDSAPDAESRERREKMAAKARRRGGDQIFPKITEEVDGLHRFVEQPPITTRVTDERELEIVRQGFEAYRATLSEDRRVLFDRYQLEDFALRVVGIGSVATRCYIALFFCDDRNSLILQIKEARKSVLEPFLTPSPFDNQGQRVVVGQRLMQAASDKFLGWLRAASGHDFYVRQLRDMKFVVPVEELNAVELVRYGDVCGRTLARSHARSGDAATIGGYLGKGDAFDVALGNFAVAYADQTEQDYTAFAAAARDGRITAAEEEDE